MSPAAKGWSLLPASADSFYLAISRSARSAAASAASVNRSLSLWSGSLCARRYSATAGRNATLFAVAGAVCQACVPASSTGTSPARAGVSGNHPANVASARTAAWREPVDPPRYYQTCHSFSHQRARWPRSRAKVIFPNLEAAKRCVRSTSRPVRDISPARGASAATARAVYPFLPFARALATQRRGIGWIIAGRASLIGWQTRRRTVASASPMRRAG